MLSRRHLRTKVMQALYARQQNPTTTIVGIKKNLAKSVKDTHKLYLFHFFTITKVAQYIFEDQKIQAKKMLQSIREQDFITKIFDNKLLQNIHNDLVFQEFAKQEKFRHLLSNDIIKKLYRQLVQDKAYIDYIANKKTTNKDDQNVFKLLFNIMLETELYTASLEDVFLNWFDDDDMVKAAVISKITQHRDRGEQDYSVVLNTIDWKERINFCYELLEKSIEHDAEFIELVSQQLKNWEIDRITQIDIILMKMALCELLYFSQIPIKVSINEYIEISKVYSTPKSKDFINGILDKLMKKLKSEGRIKKIGRGLVGF